MEAERLLQTRCAKKIGQPPGLSRQRYLAQEEYRHGRTAVNSIPLPARLSDPQNQLPYHGGPNSRHIQTNRSRAEGDELSVLFNLVLEKLLTLNISGATPRMTEIPKGADPKAFHATCWRQFTKNIDSWTTMSLPEKSKHLHSWLFAKFTMHPKNLCMNPGPGFKRKFRNDACWLGFWMTDQELHELVKEVIQEVSHIA